MNNGANWQRCIELGKAGTLFRAHLTKPCIECRRTCAVSYDKHETAYAYFLKLGYNLATAESDSRCLIAFQRFSTHDLPTFDLFI